MNLKPPSQQKGKPASRVTQCFCSLDFSLNKNLATKFVKSLDGRKRDKNAQRLGQSKHSQVLLLTTNYQLVLAYNSIRVNYKESLTENL